MKIRLFTVLCAIGTAASAQFSNNAAIYIGSDAVVTSNMDLINNGTISNEGTLDLKKNVKNDGVLKSTGKIQATGSQHQHITGSRGIETAYLDFNNAGTTLSTTVTVNKYADFNNGIVETSPTAPISFAKDAQAFHASDASHVSGLVNSKGTKNFMFPVGDGTQLKAFSVAKTNDHTAGYVASSPMALSEGKSEDLDQMNQEYWTLSSKKSKSATNIEMEASANAETVVALENGAWTPANENADIKNGKISSNIVPLENDMFFTIGKSKKTVATVGIFPNPTRGEFKLKFNQFKDSETVKVRVCLGNGTEIMQLEGKVGELKELYTLPEDLSSQHLLLKVERVSKNQNFVERIVFDK